MGYLNNSSVTVDAILTKKGRELLAEGRDSFRITQFAIADDEIDYDLWNPDHPLGSNYYGIIIVIGLRFSDLRRPGVHKRGGCSQFLLKNSFQNEFKQFSTAYGGLYAYGSSKEITGREIFF